MEVDAVEKTPAERIAPTAEVEAAQLHSDARERDMRARQAAEAKPADAVSVIKDTDVIKTLRPGANGTKKFLQHYGESLVAVRYRRDNQRKRQLTTIELVIDEREPPTAAICRNGELSRQRLELQSIKLDYDEIELRQAVKRCGARWDAKQKVWWLKREDIVALRLNDRVVTGLAYPEIDFV